MSFSQDVKTELENVLPQARHCQLAELSAISVFLNKEPDMNSSAGRKFFTLQKKTSMINRYVEAGIKNSCCKRAYLRGAFLCIGSMTDPMKGYDLEFVCELENDAVLLQSFLKGFDIESKISIRKKQYILYIKDAEGLVDTLNVMGAHNSLMDLENLRVEKDFRNLINRKVNCEAANITKTVNASAKQIEDILKIEASIGFESLPPQLRQMAEIRIEHADSSLSELGTFLDPPVGKSGVNHRLRKLTKIAESIEN